MYFEHFCLTSAKTASPLNDIERKPPSLLLFLVLKVVRYHQRQFVFTKNVYCSRCKVFLCLHDVSENICSKQTNKQIFMDKYCLSC